MFILNVLFYFVSQSTFYMNKDKALESVNEIKELMEKSSKFISVSGLAAILAGIYALAGAYIATQVITPETHLIVTLEFMAIIALSVLAAAAGSSRVPSSTAQPQPLLPVSCLTVNPKRRDRVFSAGSPIGHYGIFRFRC